MTHLIRNRQVVTDDYQQIADEQPLPASGKIILSWAYWQKITSATERLIVGIRIPNTLNVQEYWNTLNAFPLIALEFPSFADGRAYSQARLLRDLGYNGEIRATGLAVVRDQLQGMERCGINSFQLRPDQSAEQASKAFLDFSLNYQPAAEEASTVRQLRI